MCVAEGVLRGVLNCTDVQCRYPRAKAAEGMAVAVVRLAQCLSGVARLVLSNWFELRCFVSRILHTTYWKVSRFRDFVDRPKFTNFLSKDVVEGARTSDLEVLVYQGLLEGLLECLLEGLHHGAQGRSVGTGAVTGGARTTVIVGAVTSVAHHGARGRGEIDRPDENDHGCHIRSHLEESLERSHESISNLPSRESTKSKRRKERKRKWQAPHKRKGQRTAPQKQRKQTKTRKRRKENLRIWSHQESSHPRELSKPLAKLHKERTLGQYRTWSVPFTYKCSIMPRIISTIL